MRYCFTLANSFTIMEIDWESFINFPEDAFTLTNKNNENSRLEDNIMPPNSNVFIELEVESIEPVFNNINTSNDNQTPFIYQYNLCVGDIFDDWISVDTFIHNYYLERGFGYQVYRNDKDIIDHSVT